MRSMRIVERLITERWPDLKQRAEKETDYDTLIAILGEIDDVLLVLEQRIAANDQLLAMRDGSDPTSNRLEHFSEVRMGGPAIRSQ